MKIKIVLLFSIVSYSCLSQVPGYMGKRFSIGYSNYFMPAFIGPTANSTATNDSKGINTVNCLNLEYTIKNRTNLCISVQSLKTGVYSNALYRENSTDIYGNDVYDSYQYSPNPYTPMQLRTINVSIGFKFFNKGKFAPIGNYRKFEMLLLFSNLTYGNNSYLVTRETDNYGAGYNNSTFQGNLGAGAYTFTTVAFAFTLGHSRVLFDRIVLDYGLRFSMTPQGVWAALNSADGSDEQTFAQHDVDIKNDTNRRILLEQLVNVHIGIGFLAF